MLVKVRSEEFNIDLVNNYVLEKYQDLVDLASFEGASYALDIDNLAEEADEEMAKAETLKEKREIKSQYKDQMRIEFEGTKALKKKVVELRQLIIKELLESNKYEYDESWWMRKASTEDNNDFMNVCMKKDYEPVGSTVSKKK